jgi:hypothetical protein
VKEFTMSAQRIAVLVGSHDRAYFVRRAQSDRPSEAAVLAAMRAQRSTSEASRASVAHTAPRTGQGIVRLALGGTRAGREHASDPAGPRPLRAFAAARTRRPPRRGRARMLAQLAADA